MYVYQYFSQSGTGKSLARIGEGPILTLERVERQQSGVYQCTADNSVGEAATVDMRLDVLCKFEMCNLFAALLHY
jgi:hypothetical protein